MKLPEDIVFDPLIPWPVILAIFLALGAGTVWLYLTLGRNISRRRNIALLVFRLVGLALILILLLQPSRREIIPPPVRTRVILVALDTSKSMKQTDEQRASRLDAARQTLIEQRVLGPNGFPLDGRVRMVEFSDAARPVTGSALDLTAKGATTCFHKSVSSAFATLAPGEEAAALVLLSDGHDFEMVNPVQTALLARNRRTPIYAVAFGKQGKVRDVSTRIISSQPYCYVKQKARIAASLRLIGCELEEIQVQLLRNGAVVRSVKVAAGDEQEVPVEFEVVEPEVGQFEYEVRALPVEGESDTANNSALTYLNVIDQQIQVLLLEGAPYWDSAFLQRSLMRNDKFNVDALVKYADRKLRPIRKNASAGEFKLPQNAREFGHYDVVLLGREVDGILSMSQIAALGNYVREGGGTVIFTRGPAFRPGTAEQLEPVLWKDEAREKVRLQAARMAQVVGPFKGLTAADGSTESLPEMIAGHEADDAKALSAILAHAKDRDGALFPAIVHRRYGSGQVVSIGVDGLWRWGFNPNMEGPNTAFDRFWDQLLLWLLAARDILPSKPYSFRPNSANIPLGEKAGFRLSMRHPDANLRSVPVRITLAEREAGRIMLTPDPGSSSRLIGDFLPEKTGRYQAVAELPDGPLQARFIVYSENLEETEVATDAAYLRRLCEASGGRLIKPDELGRLIKELRNEEIDVAPKTRLVSLWDRAWVFYVIGMLLGLDWYLRRRWGLT